MPHAYKGELYVDDFTLRAERFVVRDAEVAFGFEGHHLEWGSFKTAGVANMTPQGIHIARDCPVRYLSYDGDGSLVTFRFTRIEATDECVVEGEWREGEDEDPRWPFEGTLTSFRVSSLDD